MKPINTLIPAPALVFFATTARPDEPPRFYENTYPEHALKSRLEAEAVLTGEGAKLDAKTRELVTLGVAAQIPCAYCVCYLDKAARGEGIADWLGAGDRFAPSLAGGESRDGLQGLGSAPGPALRRHDLAHA